MTKAELESKIAALCDVPDSQVQLLVDQYEAIQEVLIDFMIDPSPQDARQVEADLQDAQQLSSAAAASSFFGVPVLLPPHIERATLQESCLCRVEGVRRPLGL